MTQQFATNAPRTPALRPTLIVFSHQRWNCVVQRAQQLMSRLARSHRVVFVEEPVQDDGPAQLVRSTPAPGVEVLCPHTPLAETGFHDRQLPLLQSLLSGYVRSAGINDPVLWFDTPLPLPLAAVLEHSTIVYDCVDSMPAQEAPLQWRQREQALLQVADIVLAGGPSLYEAQRDSNDNVHCLPSAVDGAHFAPQHLQPHSNEAAIALRLHTGVGGPRLGFFGVIDDRIDLALVAALAAARPDWHWVMAGPVVKIDPQSLPQAPNLHWLGMQPYPVLPHLAAAWDVCLMPFALNAATRFISPAKTLEYMAAEKPIVSTAVHDVSMLYGDTVHIAHDTAEFLQACERALAETLVQRAERVSAMLTTVWRMSWDNTVVAIEKLLREAAGGARPVAVRHGRVARVHAAQA